MTVEEALLNASRAQEDIQMWEAASASVFDKFLRQGSHTLCPYELVAIALDAQAREIASTHRELPHDVDEVAYQMQRDDYDLPVLAQVTVFSIRI